MPINSKIKSLYDALKADGADVGSEQEFSDWFQAPGEQGYNNRKYVYDTFKADGADVGKNYEEFAGWLGLHAVQPQVAQAGAERQHGEPEPQQGGQQTGQVTPREVVASQATDKQVAQGVFGGGQMGGGGAIGGAIGALQAGGQQNGNDYQWSYTPPQPEAQQAPQGQPQIVQREINVEPEQEGGMVNVHGVNKQGKIAITEIDPLTSEVDPADKELYEVPGRQYIRGTDERGNKYLKDVSDPYTTYYYDDGSVAQYLTYSDGETKLKRYKYTNGDVLEYDDKGNETRIEAPHIPRIGDKGGLIYQVYKDPYLSENYDTGLANIFTKYKNNEEFSEANKEYRDKYSKYNESQLRNELQNIRALSSQASGTDKINLAYRYNYVMHELNARHAGFSNREEAERNPGMYAFRRLGKWLADYYPSDFSDMMLDENTYYDRADAPRTVLEGKAQEVVREMAQDAVNGNVKKGAYYLNKVLSDEKKTADFLNLCMMKARWTNQNPDSIVNQECDNISTEIGSATERLVDAAVDKAIEQTPKWKLAVYNMLGHSAFGQLGIWMGKKVGTWTDQSERDMEIMAHKYKESLSGWGKFGIGVGSFVSSLPEYMLASSGVGSAFGGTAIAATTGGRILMSTVTMTGVGLLNQGAHDLNAGEFSGWGQWASTGFSSAATGAVFGVAGEGARAVSLRPTSQAAVLFNKGIEYSFETAAITAPEWVSTVYNGVTPEGEPVSGEYFVSSALNNLGVVIAMKGRRNFKNWKPVVNKSDLAQLQAAYPELYDNLTHNLDMATRGKPVDELSEAARRQLTQLQDDMTTPGKGVSWTTYKKTMNLFGYEVIPPAPSAVRENGRVVQVLDPYGTVISEKKCANSGEAKKEASKLQSQIEHSQERRNAENYTQARMEKLYYDTCADIADRMSDNKEWRKRGEDGNFLVDENGNYIADENYQCVTPEEVDAALNEAYKTPEAERTADQAQLVAIFEADARKMGDSIPDVKALAEIVCSTYGITVEQLENVSRLAPSERRDNKATQAMQLFNEMLTRGVATSSRPVGRVKLKHAETGDAFIDVYNEANPANKDGYYFYKDTNGKTRWLPANEVDSYEPIVNESEQRYKVSNDNTQAKIEKYTKDYENVASLYNDELLDMRINNLLEKYDLKLDEEGNILRKKGAKRGEADIDENGMRTDDADLLKLQTFLRVRQNRAAAREGEENMRNLRSERERAEAVAAWGQENGVTYDVDYLVEHPLELDGLVKKMELGDVAELSSGQGAVTEDNIVTSPGDMNAADAAQYKTAPIDETVTIEGSNNLPAPKTDKTESIEAGGRYNVVDEQNTQHEVEVLRDNGNGTVEVRVDGAEDSIPMAKDQLAAMLGIDVALTTPQTEQPATTTKLEQPAPVATNEMKDADVDAGEAGLSLREKAGAYVDAYFPDVKGDEREGFIEQLVAQNDFENTIRFDKEDGVNLDRVAKYEQRLAELEKERAATNSKEASDDSGEAVEPYRIDEAADPDAIAEAGFSEDNLAATVDYLNGKIDKRKYLERLGFDKDVLAGIDDDKVNTWVEGVANRASEFLTDKPVESGEVKTESDEVPADAGTTLTPTPQPEAADATKEVEATPEPMPMREVGKGKNKTTEPDWQAVSPERGREWLFNESGLDNADANEIVNNNLEAAQKAVDKASKLKPKKTTNPFALQAERERIANEQVAAQSALDYWKKVKAIEQDRQAQAAAERKAKDAEVAAQAQAEEAQRQAEELAKQQEQAQRGAGAVHPAIAEKWGNAPKIEGYKDEVVLANGERVPGTYYLVESGAVTPSHNASREFEKYEGFPVDENGNTINDRDYERDKDAQNITRSIADKYDSRALQTPVIVSKDGVVLSGNGRTMAGELAASNNTDGAYIEHLKNYGRKYGFSPEQVTSMKHPRAVFVPDADMPYTTDTFAKFNAQEMKGQSKTEQAVKLGKVVDDATFNQIVRAINDHEALGDFYGDTKAATEAINALRRAGAINDMQYAEMFDGDAVSDRGRQIIENMLIGKAFEGNPDVIRMLTEYKGFRQSVVTALNEISTNVALGKDYSLENELAQGIELAYKARKAGFKENELVSPYATQLNLFPFEDGETVADYNNAAVLLLADLLNDKRPTLLKKKLQDYNQQSAESAAGQMDIFAGGVKEKKEIIKTVLNTLHNGETEETSRPEQRGSVADERGGEASLQEDGAVDESSASPVTPQTEPSKDAAIVEASKATNTEPTDAQKEAGNYKKGHVKIDGFEISIEQPKGSVRSGVDDSGKPWSQTMNNTYGYIRGTEGVDGDHIDVFLSDNLDGWNGTVYVVDQVEKGGIFDEHKVMYGFNSEEEARKAYLSNYKDGWDGLGAITAVSKDEFKKWIDSSHRKTKPFAEYKNVKVGGTQEQEPKQQGTLFPATEQQPAEIDADIARFYKGTDSSGRTAIDEANYNADDLVAPLLVDGKKSHIGITHIVPDNINEPAYTRAYYDYTHLIDPKTNKGWQAVGDKIDEWNASHKKDEQGFDDGDAPQVRFPSVDAALKFADWFEGENTTSTDISKSETKPRTTEKQPAEAPKERIDDVGEKIEGAKKDLAQKMGERINLDADTFPKMFPKYDLKQLISQGLDPSLAVMTKMLRQMAQADYKHYSKKRMYGKNYALRAARFYAAYAKQVLEAGDSNVDFKSEGLGFTDYGKQFVELNKRLFEELHKKLGDDIFDLDLTGVKMQPISQKEGTTWYRRDQETGESEPYNPAYAFIGPRGQSYYEANELDKALQEGVEQVSKSIDYKKTHPYKLGHYYKPGVKNSDYVGVKLGGKVVPLTEPMTSSEVRKYMSEHNAELQAKAAQLDEQRKLDKKKGGTGEGRWKPELTLGGGRPRVGADRRGGIDIEAEEFMKSFGFRGVQFGNYVTQRERQRFLNEAYDALMDMAELLGISPRALAIDGRLGLAIGARGGGKANAHYEPKENVINLTKSKGAGSLAHEWFHALDYYFNKSSNRPTSATANKSAEQFPASTRDEMRKAFLDLMSAIKNSDYFKRSENLEMKLRSGKLDEGYYDKPTELAARAFQDYVVRKLADKGKINDFLSSFTSEEEWNGEPENYPYPVGAEAEKIDEKFDALFDAMQERTDEEGNTILYHLGKDHDVLTDTEIALRDGLVDVMRSVGIDVETDEVKGQKVLDNAIQANATLQEMRGWHGSAAEFDEFDHSHMSEGEGNQAIGYGTYIASIEEIGRYYGTVAAMQKRFRAAPGYGDYDHYWKGQKIDLSSINPLRMAYDIVQREGTIKKAITMVEKFVDNPEAHEGWRSALDILRESRKSDFKRKRANYEGERYLYEVDIPENDGTNYLPWDEPLSDAMRERIAQGLRDMGVDLNEPFERRTGKADNFDFLDEQMSEHPITGQELYYKLVDRFGRYPQQASEFLNKYCGLVGIEYPSNFFSGGNKKGLKNHVIFNEKDIKIDNRTQYFISADGVVYGFVKDGKIYIDPKIATAETPIHEYCHLWGDALKEANPEAWERLKERMLGEKDVLDYVKKMYPGLEGDALVSEVFSHYSGKRGAERLRADMEREVKNAEGVFAKARVARVFDIIRRALSRFWEMARDLFAGKNSMLNGMRAEDFADMAMNDLLRGFKPSVAERTKGERGSSIVFERGSSYRNGNGEVIKFESHAEQMSLFGGGDDALTQRTERKVERQKRASEMSDAELLKEMGRDIAELEKAGRGDWGVQTLYSEEYDRRHIKEYNEECDRVRTMLDENNVGIEEAEQMLLDTIFTWREGYATADRSRLLAQFDTINDYYAEKTDERDNADLYEEERGEDTERADARTTETPPTQEEVALPTQQTEPAKPTKTGFDPSAIKLRKLKSGETCYVERRYQESGGFDFTGSEVVKSDEDLAYIFRNLENSAIENTFLVLIKDGKATILHTGMGSYSAAVGHTGAGMLAASQFKPQNVIMVHNHPSGNLNPSMQDVELQKRVKRMFGENVVREAIIIDITSGQYSVFDTDNTSGTIKQRPTSAENEVDYKTYSFSKYVFNKGYKPGSTMQITDANKAAAFVSSHRLGERDKLSLLVMNRAKYITGNVFLPWTNLDDVDITKAANKIATYIHQMGGESGIIYGSGTIDRSKLGALSREIENHEVRLDDFITVEGRSAQQEGVLEDEVLYEAVPRNTEQQPTEVAEDGVGYGEADDSGISDEELAGYDAGRYSFAESITQGLVDLALKNTHDQQLRLNAMREFGGNLAKLRKIMNKQKAYDKGTVDDIVRLARMVMGSGFFKDMSAYEVKRLLAAIKKGVGAEDLTPIANNVVDMLVQHQLRESKNMLHKLMQVRGRKVDARGVEVQAGLDIDGQRMMSALKDGMSLGENGLLTRINDCENRLGSEDEVIRKNAMSEYQGLMLAKEYHDNILSGEEEEIVLRQEKRQEQEKIYDFHREPVLDQDGNAIMNLDGSVRTVERKTLKPEFKGAMTDENKQLRRNTEAAIERIEQSIRESRMERVTSYIDFMSDVAGDVRASRERAAEWRAEQQQRVDEIHHNANSDLEGVPVQSQVKLPEGGLLAFNSNNDIVRLLFQPLATFEKMLRFFGRKAHNGEGYLFNRFMRGWVDCSDKEWRSKRAAHEELDAKVNELFGKKAKRWSDLYKVERNKKHPGIPVEYWDNGERVQETMSQGEALSLVVWSKQKDAEAGLRRMGISEEDIETIKNNLDPKFLQLAEWVVEEFLPKRREYYNEIHERMFGAPMAAIEHYFPIVRNSRDVEKPSDITERDLGETKPSTITGNIIKRQRTAATLDVHTDFFDHLLKHLDDMENWAAWAEFNRDINTLRNYKRFKNRVLNMHSVEYGSGKDLWKAFDDACAIAAGVYHPSTKRGSGDNLAVNIAKGVTGAKIAFRFYTAAKQLLSLPAFWNGDAGLKELAKWENPVGAIIAWNWAMKNLPGFSKRWQSRQVGDVRLMDTDSDYAFWRNNMIRALSRGGMWANALVDGMTVAMGARSVYETKKKRYLRNGYSEEQAEKRAMQDAAISYNSSQQSSEDAFLSSLQLDRTWWSTLMTVFRSASMGYQRRLTTGLRNLKNRMKKGYKAESIEFMKKQMMRDGIDEATAEKAARRTYRWGGLKSMADVFVYGFVLPFFWNLGPYALYLLMGDDDDEKKDMLKDASVHSLFGPVEGLTGGNAMSEIGNTYAGYLMSDNDKSLLNALRYHDYLSMPLGSDLQQIFNEAGNDSMAAWTDAFNLLVQAGIGINPETFTDAWVAIADACEGDPQTTKEFALCFMRVMQVPQTQTDKLFIDELGMTAKDAQKLNAMEMADRYARYKKFRNAPLLNWAYSPDESKKVAEKYRNRFLDNMQERMEHMDDEQLGWNFENPNDSERRKAVGKVYAKGKGVQDSAGKKPAGNWKPETRRSQLKYQRLRDWTDLAEDVLLDTAIEQAKNRGDDEKLKALRDAKKELTEIKRGKHTETWDVNGLGDGSAEDDKAIMDELRARRKEILQEYGII